MDVRRWIKTFVLERRVFKISVKKRGEADLTLPSLYIYGTNLDLCVAVTYIGQGLQQLDCSLLYLSLFLLLHLHKHMHLF